MNKKINKVFGKLMEIGVQQRIGEESSLFFKMAKN